MSTTTQAQATDALAANLVEQARRQGGDPVELWIDKADLRIVLAALASQAPTQPSGDAGAGAVLHTFTPWDSLPWKPKPIGFAKTGDIELYAKVLTIKPVDAEHQVAIFTRDQLQRAVSAALMSMDGLQEVAPLSQVREQAALPAGATFETDFEFKHETQEHVPTVLVRFAPIKYNSPNDTGSWAERDKFIAALTQGTSQAAAPVALSDQAIADGWKAWPRTAITSAERAIEFIRFAEKLGK